MVTFLKIIMVLILVLYLAFLGLILLGMKYRNPYQLFMMVGPKGSGKSTLICKLTQRYRKKGWTVYSNVAVPGALLFEGTDIGKIQFTANSVVFVDEIGMVFDNRNFKTFRQDTRDWFKLQRHYRVKVFCFSQAWDVDVKIRQLCDGIYLLNSYFNVISVARKVRRRLTIVHPSGEAESRIADDLEFVPWFMAPFGGLMVTWLPAWHYYFDSFAAPELDHVEFVECSYPDSYFDHIENSLRVKAAGAIFSKVEKAGAKAAAVWWKLHHRDFH